MAIKQLRSIYQIKVSLKGSKPPIWRRLLVPSTISLSDFHLALQIAMGWTNSHLHQFASNQTFYGIPDIEFDLDFEIKNESKFKLSQLLKQEKDTLLYEYDFGDGWEHNVVLEKVLPFDISIPLPSCIRGKRSCPPEDCGGIWGYQDLLEVVQDPSHPEYEGMLEWLGDEFDPKLFNIKEVNERLIEYCN